MFNIERATHICIYILPQALYHTGRRSGRRVDHRLTRRFKLSYSEDLRIETPPLVAHWLASELTCNIVVTSNGRNAHLLNLIYPHRWLETGLDHLQRACDYSCRSPSNSEKEKKKIQWKIGNVYNLIRYPKSHNILSFLKLELTDSSK